MNAFKTTRGTQHLPKRNYVDLVSQPCFYWLIKSMLWISPSVPFPFQCVAHSHSSLYFPNFTLNKCYSSYIEARCMRHLIRSPLFDVKKKIIHYFCGPSACTWGRNEESVKLSGPFLPLKLVLDWAWAKSMLHNE